MAILETKHERKSMAITIAIYVALMILLLLFGFKYMNPPLQEGIAVNFGTSSVGMGNVQPKQPVASAPKKNPTPPQPSSEQATPVVNEDVATQDNQKAPVVKDREKEPKTQSETQTETPVKKPVPEPKPDESTKQALENIINGPEKTGEESQGEGNDNRGGDKGDPNGTLDADSYYGTGKGNSGSGNYRLGGREALVKKTFQQNCNQSGIVVVRIEVDRQGNVISAVPGVKGTTNSDPCLTKPAKRAALATKFNPDPNAPVKQVGVIIYEFKLSD